MKRIIILILVMIPFLGYGQLKEVQRGALNNSRAEHAINAGINQTNTNTADIAALETAEVDTTSLDNRITINAAMLEDSLGWSGGFTTEAEAPYFLFYNPLTAAISYYDTTGWGGGTGGGFVIGPAGAVTNRIVTFDGITGELIQDGGNTIAEVLARANHTGTQTASTISDFDVEVANNPAVTLNTAKTGVTSTITVDAINELTLDEGVAIEGVYLENQNIRLNSDQSINFDNLGGAVWIKGNGATDLQFHDTHYDKTLSELVIDTTNLSTRLDTTATDVNANTAAIVLNTAKTTNATHTSEVTGATDLTIADGVIEAVNIESTNVQSDNDGMTYDAASGGFTWGAVVDQVARDSTVANAEDIATNGAMLQDSLGWTESQVYPADYYIAPWGDDASAGTYYAPFATAEQFASVAVAGDTAYMRGGRYYITTLNFGKGVWFNSVAGTAAAPVCLFNYPGEKPILDFSLIESLDEINGICVRASSYIHIKGLRVTEVVQRDPTVHTGIIIDTGSDHITIENCESDHIGGYGYMLDNTTTNTNILYLNCDAYFCDDSASTVPHVAADGFGHSGPSAEGSGAIYTYKGCRAWDITDDGFDGNSCQAAIIWEDCWAFNIGRIPGTLTLSGGEGMGFKLGDTSPEGNVSNFDTLRYLNNCITANNLFGIHPSDFDSTCTAVVNNTFAYSNNYGIYLKYAPSTVKNSISYDNVLADIGLGGDGFTVFESNNSWNLERTILDKDFMSLDTTQLYRERKLNGDLPDITFGKLSDEDRLGPPVDQVARDSTAANAEDIAAVTSNATHSGDVAGATTLTIQAGAVDAAMLNSSNALTDGYFPSYNAAGGNLTWEAGVGGSQWDLVDTMVNTFTTWNILEFGATSGNSSDEDTTAINYCIRQASAATEGGIVYIPNGEYYCRGPIIMQPNVTLQGGQHVEIWYPSGYTGAGILIQEEADGQQYTRIKIDGIKMRENSPRSYLWNGLHIEMTGDNDGQTIGDPFVSWSNFSNLDFHECKYPIYIKASEDGWFNSNHFDNIGFVNCAYGLKTVLDGTSPTYINANVFSNFRVQYGVGTYNGIDTLDANDNTFVNWTFWDHQYSGTAWQQNWYIKNTSNYNKFHNFQQRPLPSGTCVDSEDASSLNTWIGMNLFENRLVEATMVPQSSVTAEEGKIYYDSDDNHFYGHNGTTWIQLDN